MAYETVNQLPVRESMQTALDRFKELLNNANGIRGRLTSLIDSIGGSQPEKEGTQAPTPVPNGQVQALHHNIRDMERLFDSITTQLNRLEQTLS